MLSIETASTNAAKLITQIPYFNMRRLFSEALSTRPECFFTAYEGEIPVGIGYHCYNIGMKDRDIFLSIFVLPEYRRKGIGTAILRTMISTIDIDNNIIATDGIYEGEDHEIAIAFCHTHGAKAWQSLLDMEYSGGLIEEEIPTYPYLDSYFGVLNDAKCRAWAGLAAHYGFYIDPGSFEQRKRWLDNAENAYVYVEDGVPVAYCASNGRDYLHGLFVDPQFASRGIGRAMVIHGINLVKARGFDTVKLSVLTENPAKHIYQKLGFKTVATKHYLRLPIGKFTETVKNSGKESLR